MVERKPGGQAKAPQDRKRNNLTFRTRDHLRERLEEAARVSGRSVSEEIEHRLNRTFSQDVTHAAQLQIETDMRLRAEDDLAAAETRIEALELQLLNIGDVIERSIVSAFEKAGLSPKGNVDGNRS